MGDGTYLDFSVTINALNWLHILKLIHIWYDWGKISDNSAKLLEVYI